MPPEQALGEWDAVDERADVFALGAILCEILTGKPPYGGSNWQETLRRAKRGDLSDGLGRLERCGADVALTALCRECLASAREDRPRNAGVVAERVAAHQAEVQERLRQAELERVAAEARTAEEQARTREALARVAAERRARQRLLALAAAVLLLVAGIGGASWWLQQQWAAALARQTQADQEAREVLEGARGQLDQGWRTNNLAILTAAKAEGERAGEIARSASEGTKEEASAFVIDAEDRLKRAEKSRELLVELLNVASPQKARAYAVDESGQLVVIAQKSVDEQYASAFRRWGLDVEGQPETEVVTRLREESEPVVQNLIAVLDAWMMERRLLKRPKDEWRRLFRVADRLDRSERQRQLRALLVGEASPRAESVVGLLGSCPPWPALWELERGSNWRPLLELRGRMNPATESVFTVMLLAHASKAVGDVAGAERVLRQAVTTRPDEVVLLSALGRLLELQGPSRLGEAIECYRAARARLPGLGISFAKALEKAGRVGEGEEVLRDLVRREPNNPEILDKLAESLFEQRKFGESEVVLRKVIALKPDSAEAHYNLGNSLRELQKPDAAKEAYQRAIALKPDFAMAYSNLGVLVFSQHKMAEAESAWRKAIALKPDFFPAHVNLGVLLKDQRKPEEAEAALRKAIALKPDHAGAYADLGETLYLQCKLAEAETAYYRAIALEPDSARVYNNLAAVLKAQRKPVEAEAALRKAIAIKLDYAEAYTGLGAALADQGKLEEAVVVLHKSIALKPDLSAAYLNLGSALLRQRKLKEAEMALRKAIALKPDDAETYVTLGAALNDQRKLKEAEVVLHKAIVLKPKLAEAYNNLGFNLREQRKLTEAMAAWHKAITLKPDFPEVYCNLGNVYYEQRKLAEAVTAWRKAIELNPDFADAYVNLGTALRHQRKLEEAVAAYRKGIAVKPDNDRAYGGLGITFAEQGKLKEAVAALRKAIELKPDSAPTYSNLGNALREQGKLDEAVMVLRKAIELQPNLTDAYFNLALALVQQAQFTEALTALEKGRDRLPLVDPKRIRFQQGVQYCQKLVKLDTRLPAVITGKEKPESATQQIEFAQICVLKKIHFAAARFYDGAFSAEPKLAADLNQQHRYKAACSAALAASGRGKDARMLPDKVVGMFRRWAFRWLSDDLKVYSRDAKQKPQLKQEIQRRLTHWKSDPDLVSVRDRQALDRLHEDERAEWQALWCDVDELAKQVATNAKP
jgi:tetratricopeptide (TPR) repeat protein